MIPAAIEGLTPEDRVAFLQHWYPVVRERVDQRASDPDRHAALLSLAERMNPDGWAPDDVEAKLQQAGEAPPPRPPEAARRGAAGDAGHYAARGVLTPVSGKPV